MLISKANSVVFDGAFDHVRSGDDPVPSQVKAAVRVLPNELLSVKLPVVDVVPPLLDPPPPHDKVSVALAIQSNRITVFFVITGILSRTRSEYKSRLQNV